MSSTPSSVNTRALFFITHYLPWIGICLLIIGILIVYFHYRNKSCMFDGKEDDETEYPAAPYNLFGRRDDNV